MTAELMLINPRRRRRTTRTRKAPRRRMSALQAKYFGKRRGTAPARRRRSVARVTRVQSNPTPRRRRKRSIMRVRRNSMSISRSTGKITNALVPAAIGAGGALALNFAWNKFAPTMLPASMQTGITAVLVQLAASMGIGVVAGMALGKARGAQVAAGAMTVTLFGIANTYIAGGGLGTGGVASGGGYTYSGGYGYAGGGYSGMAGVPRRMGRYVGGPMGGNTPRNLNRYVGHQMNGMVPRGLNGPRRGRGGRMGYVGPARTV